MSLSAVEEIERAIEALSPGELEKVYEWLGERDDPFDTHIKADLEAGRLDRVILEALSDIENGRTGPL